MIHALVRETVRDVIVPLVIAGIVAWTSIRVATISKPEQPEEDEPQGEPKGNDEPSHLDAP